MRRILTIAVCGLVLSALSASPALAQGLPWNRNLFTRPSPTASPAISPYLNLLRSGSSSAVNYYGLVRPQQEFRSGIQGLQQEVQNYGYAPSQSNSQEPISETGHHAGFMTQGANFMNLGAGSTINRSASAGTSQIPSKRPSSSR